MNDNKDIYVNEIEPLVKKILDICEKNKINFFSTMQLDDTELNKTSYFFNEDSLNKMMYTLFIVLSKYGVFEEAEIDCSHEK